MYFSQPADLAMTFRDVSNRGQKTEYFIAASHHGCRIAMLRIEFPDGGFNPRAATVHHCIAQREKTASLRRVRAATNLAIIPGRCTPGPAVWLGGSRSGSAMRCVDLLELWERAISSCFHAWARPYVGDETNGGTVACREHICPHLKTMNKFDFRQLRCRSRFSTRRGVSPCIR